MTKMADDPILIDTNVLLIASTPARPLHLRALGALNEWPNRGVGLYTTGQILREYLVVATRPWKVNGLGLSTQAALSNLDHLRGRLRLLDETSATMTRLLRLIQEGTCRGKQIHDANLAAVAITHGVRRILTANPRDFKRYEPQITVVDLSDL